MDFKTTSTKRERQAFTLIEVMVASGLAVLVLFVVVILSMFSSRSFAAIANYVQMDQISQMALDKMSREVRQARRVTAVAGDRLAFEDNDRNPVSFVYNAQDKTLVRIGGGETNIYLKGCDSLSFTNYQGTIISNTFNAYNPAFVTNTRLIKVTWVCSRAIFGARVNTESVQSAKITLRNNY